MPKIQLTALIANVGAADAKLSPQTLFALVFPAVESDQVIAQRVVHKAIAVSINFFPVGLAMHQ